MAATSSHCDRLSEQHAAGDDRSAHDAALQCLLRDQQEQQHTLLHQHDELRQRLAIAEAKQHLTEQLLTATPRATRFGYWNIDLRTGVASWSADVFAIYDLSPDAGTPSLTQLITHIHPDDHARFSHHITQIQSGHTTPECLFRIITGHGAERMIRGTGIPLLNDDGQPWYAIGVVQDITEWEQAERASRENDERYRTLLENSPDVIMHFDRHYRHLYASPSVTRLTGLQPTQFLGKTHAELGFPEAECHFGEEQLRTVIASGEPSETEFCLVGDPGRIHFNWRLIPIVSGDGEITVLSIARDITDHRRIELQYQMLFHQMPDGFALHEIICNDQGEPVDYRFLAVNPAFERQTGLSADAIVGKTVREIIPNSETFWIEQYGRVALTGQPISFEHFSNALHRQYAVTAYCPEPHRFVTLFTDITERKQNEEALRTSETQFRALATLAPLGIYLTDTTGRCLYANPYWCKIAGLSLEEALGDGWVNGLHPENRADVAVAWQAMVATKGEWQREYRFLTRDGIETVVLGLATPQFDAQGTIIGYIGVNIDITERKRTEKALQASEEQYRLLADSGIALIWTANLDKQCDYFNQPWLDFTGRTLVQELGDGWVDGVHPDDQARCIEIYNNAFNHREHFSIEYRLRRHDGEYRWIQDEGTPRYDVDGHFIGYIGHCLDITQRRRAQEHVRRHHQQLRALASQLVLAEEAERRRIARGLHDQIGQLLLLAHNRLEILHLGADDLPTQLTEITDLLDRAITATRSLTFELCPPMLHEVGLDAAIEWLAIQIQQQYGLPITLVCDPMLPRQSEEVRTILFQAIRELLMNCVKHAGACTVIITLRADPNAVSVTVEDSGRGFNSAMLDTPGSTEQGFGLFSIRERLQHLGGALTLTSTPGHGTCARLLIPHIITTSQTYHSKETPA